MSWNIREQGHKGAQATGRQGSSARSWGTHKPTGEEGVWWWWMSRAGGIQNRGVSRAWGGVQSWGAPRAGREQPQERGGGRCTVLSVTVEFAYSAALLLVSLLL